MIGLMISVSPLNAHQLVGVEIGCSAQIAVSETGITGGYGVHFGDIVAFHERKRMDRDSDGEISENEEQVYLDDMRRTLPKGLALIVDKKQLQITLNKGSINLMKDRLAGPEPL